MNLPQYLYRGDGDPDNKRHLKATLNGSVILTDLSNGGVGREITSQPLIHLINKHVGIGWNKTHFFSFSSDENIAFKYGSSSTEYEEVLDENIDWDFAVLTLDTSTLILDSLKQIDIGIYFAQYIPCSYEFQPKYSIVLIDVLTHLNSYKNSNPHLDMAIQNAERDSEWLILPAMFFGSKGELVSKLDTNCLSEKRTFKVNEYR